MKLLKTCTTLTLSLAVLLSALLVPATKVQTASTPKLNKKAVTLRIGKTVRLKVSGSSAPVTWRSSKKSVASVTTKGRIKAKKIGTAKITAKVAGKKLSCQVTVTGSTADTKAGGKLNPLSAYDEHTIPYYEDGRKIGTFTIQLQTFESGNKANRRVLANSANPVPTSTQEYLYFRFVIKYVSGTEAVDAKDLFSYYYNIYDSTGNVQLENIDWGFYFELLEDLSDVTLAPGNTSKCSKAILVNKGNTPAMYRIRTGKNSYTWFTTKK